MQACGPRQGGLGLAVSGGPDSLALLLLAHEALPDGFEVATVDHGLRPESAGEAAKVAELCAARDIAHAALRAQVARRGNLHANARDARYAALAGWADARGLCAIVTAHHLDDQAETLLMRLNRGAAVRGLAGMRRTTVIPDGRGERRLALWRPLLGWRRAELAAVVAAAGWTPADDPSNRDSRFDRTAARALLAANPWLDPVALAQSAAHLGEADEAIEAAAAQAWDDHVVEDGEALLYDARSPRAVELRVIEWILAALGSEGQPRGSEIARLHRTLANCGTATLAGVRASAGPAGPPWRFVRAPPRRSR